MITKQIGALYNFFAVADTNRLNICPVGWHVPNEPEWNELRDLLDTDPLPGILENDSGSKMRESGLANWQLPNTNSTNESGFKALPGGIRTALGAFEVIYESAYFWSSKPINIYARAYSLFYLNEIFILFTSEKQAGMSVRCIQD